MWSFATLTQTSSILQAGSMSGTATLTFDNTVTPTADGNYIEFSELLNYLSYWDNVSQVTVTADAIADINGVVSAERIVPEAVVGTHELSIGYGNGESGYYSALNVVAGIKYTASIYLKQYGTYKGADLLITHNGASGGVYFNLDAVTATTGTVSGMTVHSSAITSVGSGWYRCSITFTNTTPTSTAEAMVFMLRVRDATSAFSYTGSGTDGIYAWGAQLNAGTLESYIKTPASSPILGTIPLTFSTSALGRAGLFAITNTPITFGSNSTLRAQAYISAATLLAFSDDTTLAGSGRLYTETPVIFTTDSFLNLLWPIQTLEPLTFSVTGTGTVVYPSWSEYPQADSAMWVPASAVNSAWSAAARVSTLWSEDSAVDAAWSETAEASSAWTEEESIP